MKGLVHLMVAPVECKTRIVPVAKAVIDICLACSAPRIILGGFLAKIWFLEFELSGGRDCQIPPEQSQP
jgi:hypothetical protein